MWNGLTTVSIAFPGWLSTLRIFFLCLQPFLLSLRTVCWLYLPLYLLFIWDLGIWFFFLRSLGIWGFNLVRGAVSKDFLPLSRLIFALLMVPFLYRGIFYIIQSYWSTLTVISWAVGVLSRKPLPLPLTSGVPLHFSLACQVLSLFPPFNWK